MAALNHILNIRKLAELATGEKMSNVYYQLNDAVKGNTSAIDIRTIRQVKGIMQTKHAESIAFLNNLEKDIKKRESSKK